MIKIKCQVLSDNIKDQKTYIFLVKPKIENVQVKVVVEEWEQRIGETK